MSSDLSPENEQFLERAVSVGMYHDRGEGMPLDIAEVKAAARGQLARC